MTVELVSVRRHVALSDGTPLAVSLKSAECAKPRCPFDSMLGAHCSEPEWRRIPKAHINDLGAVLSESPSTPCGRAGPGPAPKEQPPRESLRHPYRWEEAPLESRSPDLTEGESRSRKIAPEGESLRFSDRTGRAKACRRQESEMPIDPSLSPSDDEFVHRHIGPREADIQTMLEVVGVGHQITRLRRQRRRGAEV